MKRSGAHFQKIGDNKALHAVVFVVAMISFTMNSTNARAATAVPTDYRIGAAIGELDDTKQFAFAFRTRPPRRLRATHLELAIGTITTSQESRAFVSFGPRLATTDQQPFSVRRAWIQPNCDRGLLIQRSRPGRQFSLHIVGQHRSDFSRARNLIDRFAYSAYVERWTQQH